MKKIRLKAEVGKPTGEVIIVFAWMFPTNVNFLDSKSKRRSYEKQNPNGEVN
jgi:hypothetical protein